MLTPDVIKERLITRGFTKVGSGYVKHLPDREVHAVRYHSDRNGLFTVMKRDSGRILITADCLFSSLEELDVAITYLSLFEPP